MQTDFLDRVELNLQHPVHRAAFAYWQASSRGTGGIAGRAEIDPSEIPSLLPWVNLIDVERSPGRLRYRHRLIGTGIVSILDRDDTGVWFDELYPQQPLRKLCQILDAAVGDRQPRIVRGDLALAGKPHWQHETLFLPLACDHLTVDMMMSIAHYE